MPNRYIRESAIESERVNALSWQGEVFFRRLLNRADDFGRYTANPALLRASLFPLQLDRVSEADVLKLLEEAERCGLLGTYTHDGKRFLVLARWEKGRAKESKFPPPPEGLCKRLQTYVYTPKQTRADVPDSDTDSDTDTDTDSDTEKAQSAEWEVKFGLELPESLRTKECLDAVKLWLAYKSERRQPYKSIGLRAALTTWAKEFTAAEFPGAVQNAMAKNWQGIHPQRSPTLNFGHPAGNRYDTATPADAQF